MPSVYTSSVARAYLFPFRGLEGVGEGGRSWPSRSSLETALPKAFAERDELASESWSGFSGTKPVMLKSNSLPPGRRDVYCFVPRSESLPQLIVTGERVFVTAYVRVLKNYSVVVRRFMWKAFDASSCVNHTGEGQLYRRHLFIFNDRPLVDDAIDDISTQLFTIDTRQLLTSRRRAEITTNNRKKGETGACHQLSI